MIDVMFYFSVALLAVLLVFGLLKRSAGMLALAGVFSLLIAVMLTGEGIAYPTGWTIVGAAADENTMSAATTYTTFHTYDSGTVNMWYYTLFGGGFVWIIVALVMAIKGHGGFVAEN